MVLIKSIRKRELYNRNPAQFQKANVSRCSFVDSIQHTKTLEAHGGCVNCICYNRSGSLLASGSDDKHICLWTENGHCVQKFITDHANNIFSLIFVAEQDDQQIVSASADSSVLLHDLSRVSAGRSPHVQRWDCNNRVKRLATTAAFPKLFWSASEDGILRQYDLRSNKVEKLVDLSETHLLKSLAVNEMYPEMIALAMNDSMVPVYDRRNTKSPLLMLLPGHLSLYKEEERRSLRSALVTHVAFSSLGDELITNIGSEHIYIFNVRNSHSSPNLLGALQNFLAENPEQGNCVKVRNGRREPSFHSIRSQAKFYLKQQEHSKSIDLLSTTMNVYLKQNRIAATPFLPSSCPTSLGKGFAKLLLQRGQSFQQRGWDGDKMAALRDFLHALQIYKNNKEAHSSLIKQLIELKQFDMANTCTHLYAARFQDQTHTQDLKQQLEKATQDKSDPKNKTWKMEDYQQFCDYLDRFCGHYNFNTDIKEANWFGGRNEMIVGGSDCGSMFIWERASQKILRLFKADDYSVNAVQCHPNKLMIATSGIDHVIRLWEPKTCEPEVPEERDLSNRTYEIIKENQQRTNASIWESLLSASMGIDMLSNSIFEEFDLERVGRTAENENVAGIQCRTM